MSNYTMLLTVDWCSFAPSTQGCPQQQKDVLRGLFSSHQWQRPDGTIVDDFVAADLQQGDTISIQVSQAGPVITTIYLKQLVAIITQQAGVHASQASSPFNWKDPNYPNNIQPLGLVIFTPADTYGAPLFTTGTLQAQSWSSSGCPTYPEAANFTVVNDVTSAFEVTVCAEIWDASAPAQRAFFTHDPDMDVTP